jgi:hypothetical protein
MKLKHKSKLWMAALLGALLVSALVFSLVAAGQIKYDVCHVTNDPKAGDGHVISIADPAWETHEAHGDKMIGDGAEPNGDGTCYLVTFEAVDDEVTMPLDTPQTINVLANDSYVGDVVVSLQTGPSNGLVGPWANGTITYYPDKGFFGTDSFTYQICDTGGQCDTATVTITVGP